jgi:hypothetical protein
MAFSIGSLSDGINEKKSKIKCIAIKQNKPTIAGIIIVRSTNKSSFCCKSLANQKSICFAGRDNITNN